MTGRQVLRHRLFQKDNGSYSIDISDLPHGIYLTRILYGNQQLGIDRFIK
jgi:hypothetical protein